MDGTTEIEPSSMVVSSLIELLHEVDNLQIVVGGVPLQDILQEKSTEQDEERMGSKKDKGNPSVDSATNIMRREFPSFRELWLTLMVSI